MRAFVRFDHVTTLERLWPYGSLFVLDRGPDNRFAAYGGAELVEEGHGTLALAEAAEMCGLSVGELCDHLGALKTAGCIVLGRSSDGRLRFWRA